MAVKFLFDSSCFFFQNFIFINIVSYLKNLKKDFFRSKITKIYYIKDFHQLFKIIYFSMVRNLIFHLTNKSLIIEMIFKISIEVKTFLNFIKYLV